MTLVIRPMHLTNFNHYGAPLTLLVFAALLWLQRQYPLRHQHFPAWSRSITNLIFALPAFVALRLALMPIPLMTAFWATRHHIGLLNQWSIPPIIATLVGITGFDYAYYWWHLATHHVPLLWRFHNVHHTDLDMDVSTATRFHFCELLLSVLFRVAVVALLGVAPWALLVFEIVFECAGQFHHSNWRLPRRVEAALNLIVVTPRMHGIHHSIVREETDSNWGTIFSWWDKLHRTLQLNIPQDAITIGVPAYRDEQELTVGQLLQMPFGPQRAWQMPDGETPEREI